MKLTLLAGRRFQRLSPQPNPPAGVYMYMRSLYLSVLFLTCASFLAAQIRPALIGAAIDESRRHSLTGNTRPEATAQNDQGAVAGDLLMEHIILQLARSAADERAVKAHIDSLHNAASPNYHRWTTDRTVSIRRASTIAIRSL